MSIRSATTADAVGPSPAPLPWKNRRPTKLPSATTAFSDPSTCASGCATGARQAWRSEEHTSELQSLMRISYAVFCLKKKNTILTQYSYTHPSYYKPTESTTKQ